ncbi:MAG TPA: hypothetical protein VJM13_00340 [Sphingopyxis sp.]|nr:hypothetical protein [Sphingopyxis sp.]
MASVIPSRMRLTGERRFFLAMATALAICTFAGFARTYYLMQFTGAAALAPLVHLHGVLFTAWVLLFALQVCLISARRVDVHVWTGSVAMALAVAMVVLGVVVAIDRSQPPRLAPFTREQFLIFPFIAIGSFALFAGCGFAKRRRPDHHKRYMLLATINLAFPAFSRMTPLIPILPRGFVGAMIISDIFLAALLAYDLRSSGRIHPVTLWGGALTLLCQPLRPVIARSDWWGDIASSLIA